MEKVLSGWRVLVGSARAPDGLGLAGAMVESWAKLHCAPDREHFPQGICSSHCRMIHTVNVRPVRWARLGTRIPVSAYLDSCVLTPLAAIS